MRRVIVESPYAGDIAANEKYAETAVMDCLQRGEAPLASHLLYTRVLKDAEPHERTLGIAAGLAWYNLEVTAVFYFDRGMSRGMFEAFVHARRYAGSLEFRSLRAMTEPERAAIEPLFSFHWEAAPFKSPGEAEICDMPMGRLEVSKHGRPPTAAAPWAVSFREDRVAFYMDQAAARAGAEMLYIFNHMPEVPQGRADWFDLLVNLHTLADLGNTKNGIALFP